MGKSGRATTIQINGRTYNAITGELVAAKALPVHSSKKLKPVGHSIDGVVRHHSASHRKPASAHSVHTPAKRSATLHRQAVATAKHKAHPHQRHLNTVSASSTETIIGHERAHRAKHVQRSQAITKFATNLGSPSDPLPIVSNEDAVNDPAPALPTTTQPLSVKEELIAKHLAQVAATPHRTTKQPRAHRAKAWFSRSRNTTILATGAAAAILVGYVTYLNIPNMALKVAASRAGFEAQLPGYQPSGFRFSGPIAYKEGEITVQYASNTSDRKYIITEKESAWDSQTLLDSHVKQETQLYSTYQESGLIVYVYHGSIATWVNGGVWYTVSGDTSLTTEQLLKIAASL